MPIKGLTDRGLALPEIGQIRKGGKKRTNPSGKEIFGEDLAYFRVEFGEGEEKAAAEFRKVYGDKPNAIRTILPFNDIPRMWDAWLEAYTAGRLVARSDGENVVYKLSKDGEIEVHNWLDKDGNKVPHPKDGIAGYDYKNNPVKFKNTARLKVIVPDIARAAYLTVITHSTHDIGNISDQLAGFKELNNGQLAGIPFILRRKPKMISTPNADGTRARRKKYLVSIEVDPEWAKAKFGELNALALPNFDSSLLLPAGDIQDEMVETDFDDDEITEGVEETTDQDAPVIELIDPMGQWAVDYAAKSWNISTSDAAKAIASKNLGKRIDKKEFTEIVNF